MNQGILLGFFAHVWWGVSPIYWKQAEMVPAIDIIAHRAIWTIPVALLALLHRRRLLAVLAVFRDGPQIAALIASSVLIAVNWFLFVYAVTHDALLESSLGYYMLPLVNVLFGMLFFDERLDRAEWLAVLFAFAGVWMLIFGVGHFPFIAVGVALSFGGYGAIRKAAPVDALGGLFLESLVLAPVAGVWLIFKDGGGLGAHGVEVDLVLLGAGLVTAVPLIAYIASAKRLTMVVLGLLFYINPTLQGLIGALVFREPLSVEKMAAFGLVWSGLVVYSLDRWRTWFGARKGL